LLGTLLFFNATPKEKRIQVPVVAHYAVDEPGFKRETGILTGRQWIEGNSAEIFFTGEEAFGAMLEDIRNAEHSVTKETYNYWGEDIGVTFAEVLADACERNVRTHFLMDFVGSVMASPRQVQRNAGCGR